MYPIEPIPLQLDFHAWMPDIHVKDVSHWIDV